MPKKYKISPIIEAICEFKFSTDTQWDLTVPGLIFEKIHDRYPKKAERNIQNIELEKTDTGMQQKVSVDQYIQFSMEDDKTLVLAGPRTLIARRLGPYTSWEDFKPEIDRAYNTLSDVIDIKGFQRIGLRYVNKIVIPEDDVATEKYFEFRPLCGKDDGSLRIGSFIVGYTAPFRDGKDSCKVQLTSALSDGPGVSTFMLDLDYFLVKPETVSRDEALDWVEGAHSEIEKIFETCLTDDLRKIFGEEE